MMNKSHSIDRSFPDQNQNYWQLASIQSVAQGIPVMLVGGQLAALFGVGKAITSVLIGNLILWTVGFAIISMAAPGRDNALENVKRHLGKVGSIVATLFLVLAFLSWYILQLNSSMVTLNNLHDLQGNQLRWGAAFGAFIALLSVGGIRFIKHFSVITFPILFSFALYSIFQSLSSFKTTILWGFSFAGITAAIAIVLPGFINLPTFFRHSRSTADSYLGLCLMTIFTTIFQIYTIFRGYSSLSAIQPTSPLYDMTLIGFILLSLVAVNLVNIYFASAAWEMILPHRKSPKEYAIIGLLGTMAYTFFQISAPMKFLEDMASNFIASLGVALLIAFLIKIAVQHRPRTYEKAINIGCWLFGGIVGTIAQPQGVQTPAILIIPISATTVAFLLVIFIEETVFSTKKIFERKL